MVVVTSHSFGKMLVKAGVITEERLNKTERIVIDAKAGRPVIIYVQEIGDGEALDKLAPMLEGMIPDA